MSGEAILATVLLALPALLLFNAVTGYVSTRQKEVMLVGVPLDDVRRTVQSAGKSLLWASEGGPGDLNFRRRGFEFRGSFNPTLSVDVESDGAGTVLVQMWMSRYSRQFGIPNVGLYIPIRRSKITRALVTLQAQYGDQDVSPGQAASERRMDPDRPFR